jgi:ubiquinone/menaquinone biosynthesis C-methylase UbiE
MEPTDVNRRAFDKLHSGRGAAGGGLPPIVRRTLGELGGKRILHLQRGSGAASAELAEHGAVVTAVDARESSLEAARARWPSILWIQAEPDGLPAELRRGRFDLAFSDDGICAAAADLDAWARGLAAALHPRGELLVFDTHPVAHCLDPLLHWHVDYFADGNLRLGRIVTALARADFRLQALEEYPGEAAGRRANRRVPAFFLLYAHRAG